MLEKILIPNFFASPSLFGSAGGRLTVCGVGRSTTYDRRPEETGKKGGGSICMHATAPPPTHHCVGGKSSVRWELGVRGRRKKRFSPFSLRKIFGGRKATKCEGSRSPRRRRDSSLPPQRLQSRLGTSLLLGRGTWGLWATQQSSFCSSRWEIGRNGFEWKHK